MDGDVLFERQDGVAWITINRPSVKNALTAAMCADLAAIVTELRGDDSSRVVVVRGNGPDFTAGADLKDLSSVSSRTAAQRSADIMEMARGMSWPIFRGLHELRQPIVASVRGHVIGAGVQFVLSADLSLASETARLLLPMARLGHPVDHGESYLLPRRIGMGRVMQMLLLAETVSATDAEKYGLVNWVVPDAELEGRTDAVVERLLSGAPVAIRQMKALVRGSASRTYDEQLTAEVESLGICAATDDFTEAINAFLEKRKPAFKGS